MRKRLATTAAAIAIALTSGASLNGWGVLGHRLVALVAADHLTAAARQNVAWLLPGTSLADVSTWADDMVSDNVQTGPWHYVNIPLDAAAYERDRDCPRQPGVSAGSRNDRWRDCAVDRIRYLEERLANGSLDRADRATALKFLVHFIGDLHQPLHALSVARGGNDIPVVAFGSATCRYGDGTPYPCQLHGVWDTVLVTHRGLTERQYLEELKRQIPQRQLRARPIASPAEWAIESHGLAKAALLPSQGIVDEAYYRTHISVVDERLALGGLRLAAVLNRTLSAPPQSLTRRVQEDTGNQPTR